MSGNKEYGDYQTPCDFARYVCHFLKNKKNIKAKYVLEPTCGIGNFLKSSLIFDAEKYYGIELNKEYCKKCENEIKDSRVKIFNNNIFNFDLSGIERENLLIIGNPPWVNNSDLSAIESQNLPQKSNFKGLKGIDALTGASNFDICEYIILKLISQFKDSNNTIAMLCKTSVARNVFKELKRNSINFSLFEIYEFDATKVFSINAGACLLLITLTPEAMSKEYCNVYSLYEPDEIKLTFGYRNGKFYSNLEMETIDFDGDCCFEWRQGIKHDCSKVMELTNEGQYLFNGRNEMIEIENDLVFPLVKSSMLKKSIINEFSKYVIVTQKKVKENTDYIRDKYPLTWNYLMENKKYFDKRKSSIYKNSPLFSMFGIGEYTYSKYKVAISGFYKEPLFSVLMPSDDKPAMVDDTSYFICFSSFENAYVAMLFLNSEKVQTYIKSIAFLDAKRPYTKKVLKRIDFSKIIQHVKLKDLIETEKKLKLPSNINSKVLNDFVKMVSQ